MEPVSFQKYNIIIFYLNSEVLKLQDFCVTLYLFSSLGLCGFLGPKVFGI